MKKTKQQKLNSFFKSNRRSNSEPSSSSSDSSDYAPTKEKNKYAVPMSWTRVREVYRQ